MRRILLLIVILIMDVTAIQISEQCRTDRCIVDGPVTSLCPAGGKLYLGGQFSFAGPFTGCCVSLDTLQGALLPVAPYRIDGNTSSIISDENGGYFVAGSFKYMNNVICPNILHIKSDGTIDASFAPESIDGEVLTLALYKDTLFAGGKFRKIGSADRYGLAAFNKTNGAVLNWNTHIGRSVSALCVSGTRLYIGGTADSSGDTLSRFIASCDVTSGTILPFNPKITGRSIDVIITDRNFVYIGGLFDKINDKICRNLASFDTATGMQSIWTPQPDRRVTAMKIHKGNLFTAGYFNTIVGVDRGGLASFELETGSLTDWNPVKKRSEVYSFDIRNDIIYFGGQFDTVLGKDRYKTAAIALVDNTLLEWKIPNTNGYCRAIRCSGNFIMAGGDFSSAGWQRRYGLAAIDTLTGTLTDWAPVVKSDNRTYPAVWAFSLYGNKLFTGGLFNEINGNQRSCVAAFDLSTGELAPWNPGLPVVPDNVITAMTSGNERLFIAGTLYDNALGVYTSKMMAINIPDATVSSWATITNGDVNVLRASGTKVYAGGKFEKITGSVCTNLGSIEMASGFPGLWGPGADDAVFELKVHGNTVYVGGLFRNAGGETRKRIAALDIATGRALTWRPNLCGDSDDDVVKSINVFGSTVFAGGIFNKATTSHRHVAAIDATSAAVLDWDPLVADGGVQALCAVGSTLYVGGSFTRIGSKTSFPWFASFAITNDVSGNPTKNQQHSKALHSGNLKCNNRFVSISVNKESDIVAELYSINGKRVANLFKSRVPAGDYMVNLPSKKLSPGIYTIVLRTGNNVMQSLTAKID